MRATNPFLGAALACALGLATALGSGSAAADEEVTISHYFSGDLGLAGLGEIFGSFNEATGISVKDNPIGHEDFKTGILVRAAGGNLPDVFSYWAGARTQFVADAGNLGPIDEMWAANGLDDVVAKSVADGATMYNGERYLVPFGYHYAGMFYNAKVMAAAGVTEFPTTWDGFLALCENLKSQGITPIALGSKYRWPAQFWFDYLLLRTAGPEYRAMLMAGEAAYTDAEVQRAMEIWMGLVDAGYFAPNANADTWTDASDRVSRGDAAMTLMGTWITGYWNGNGLMAGEDYDFFEFPAIDDGVANAVVGPVDGLLISANAANRANAEALLAYLVSDVDAQGKWAQVQGALSPNVNVPTSIYTPVMMRALEAGWERRHLRVQLRPRHDPADGRSRPVDVRALHGRSFGLPAVPVGRRGRRARGIREVARRLSPLRSGGGRGAPARHPSTDRRSHECDAQAGHLLAGGVPGRAACGLRVLRGLAADRLVLLQLHELERFQPQLPIRRVPELRQGRQRPAIRQRDRQHGDLDGVGDPAAGDRRPGPGAAARLAGARLQRLQIDLLPADLPVGRRGRPDLDLDLPAGLGDC